MLYKSYYKTLIGCSSSQEVFAYLINTLKPTISGWDYFVNWDKVNKNVSELEVHLNILNVLIGKNNIEQETIKLLTEYPRTISAIPVLLACREKKFEVLESYKNIILDYESFNFNAKSDVIKITRFLKESGFLELLENSHIKSLVDYVFGIEVGLDSNGRKNRSGSSMEKIVEYALNELCIKNVGLEYLKQATSEKLEEKWGTKITVKKSSRRIDFAVKNKKSIFLIETNFYGGGGSKLKSTAGEYQTDFDRWKSDGHNFIWITDGAGWSKTSRPLEDTFNKIDTILNLSMIEKGILEKIILDE
jgi:type II restriction enzyme